MVGDKEKGFSISTKFCIEITQSNKTSKTFVKTCNPVSSAHFLELEKICEYEPVCVSETTNSTD